MYHIFPSTQPTQPQPTQPTPKLYLFDVDGTIVVSKSGRRWAATATDWVFRVSPHMFQELADDGWTVALISNQSTWKTSPDAKQKLESILTALQETNGWSPWCLVATASRKEKDTLYRKPGTALFDLLLEQTGLHATDIKVKVKVKVKMCGDAIGPDHPHPPFRWASSDFEFANAIGAEFVEPATVSPPVIDASLSIQKILLLVGNPGSGKSSFAREMVKQFPQFRHVEQDVLTTPARVRKAVVAELTAGHSVIVDATHASAKSKEPYTQLGYPVTIVWFVRDGRPWNALREKPVPEVAYAVYSKHFEEPVGPAVVRVVV